MLPFISPINLQVHPFSNFVFSAFYTFSSDLFERNVNESHKLEKAQMTRKVRSGKESAMRCIKWLCVVIGYSK
jgi:hypothetical protein